MKTRLLWLVSVLALGGLVGLLIVRDPGYVLVAYDRMAVETSLWFALLLLVATYLVVRVVLFLIRGVLRGRGQFARWNSDRRARAADQRTLRGLLLMAEGYWDAARKQLTRAAPRAGLPVLNLLGAAHAAACQGDRSGRDALLGQARAQDPDAEVAVDFTQALLEADAGQWQEARVTLERLHARVPAHVEVSRRLAECYRALGDWPALAAHLAVLKRDRAFAERCAALETEAALGRLKGGSEPAEQVWAGLRKAQRQAPAIVAAYARSVLERTPDEAERVLREAIPQHWDPELVELYGRVVSTAPGRQLTAAEGWVKAHADDAILFLTLGRLCLQNGRWAQAREHFEMSVRLAPTPAAQGELGRLCSALGEARGAELLVAALATTLPALPLPPAGGRSDT